MLLVAEADVMTPMCCCSLRHCLQELKGNIRVFARVRPPSNSEMTGAEGSCGTLATEFPNSGEHNPCTLNATAQL
jgi:hypothetical protein